MNRTEIDRHREKLILATLGDAELRVGGQYERPYRIRRLSRIAMGIPVEQDINQIDDDSRRDLLSVMSGVRDALVLEDQLRHDQAANMTIGLATEPSPYLARRAVSHE